MNIYQKMIEVRKTVPYLQKESKGYQFNYTGSSQVLGNLKNKMDELGLLLIPRVLSKEVGEHETKGGGKEYFTELNMEFTWVNAEKPEETITCTWYGQGLDNGEKGVGKAMTYAEKYFMLKFFNIATDKDDPDSFQKKMDDEPAKPPKPAPAAKSPEPAANQPSAAASSIISEAQAKRIFALAHGNNDAVKAIIGKYGYTSSKEIKKADYEAICKEVEAGASVQAGA